MNPTQTVRNPARVGIVVNPAKFDHSQAHTAMATPQSRANHRSGRYKIPAIANGARTKAVKMRFFSIFFLIRAGGPVSAQAVVMYKKLFHLLASVSEATLATGIILDRFFQLGFVEVRP